MDFQSFSAGDAKSLGDMAFNTAMTCAFPIPAIGPEVAAGVGVAEFFFNIFFPDGQRAPAWEDMVPTNADLNVAMGKLLKALQDGNWEKERAGKVIDLLTENDTLSGYWIQWTNPPLASDVDNVADFHKLMDPYFVGTAGDTPKNLAKFIEWVKQNPTKVGQTFEFYGLTGSLLIAFHKFGLIWQYNNALNDREAQHKAAMVYAQAVKDQEGTDPQDRDPLPPYAADRDPIDRNKFIRGNNHTTSIMALKELDPNTKDPQALVDYGEKVLLKAVLAAWDNRQKDMDDRLAQIVIEHDGDSYWVKDRITGATTKNTPTDSQLVNIDLSTQRGAVEDVLWPVLTDQYALKDIEYEKIQQFKDTIAQWKAAIQSVVDCTIDVSKNAPDPRAFDPPPGMKVGIGLVKHTINNPGPFGFDN